MKTLITLLIFFLAGAGNIQAQVKPEIIKGEDQRIPVKYEELPEPVKKALADKEYKEWKMEEAYLVQEEIKIYEITLVKGEEKQVIRMDENGSRPGKQ